jgi:hypothetical protein
VVVIDSLPLSEGNAGALAIKIVQSADGGSVAQFVAEPCRYIALSGAAASGDGNKTWSESGLALVHLPKLIIEECDMGFNPRSAAAERCSAPGSRGQGDGGKIR